MRATINWFHCNDNRIVKPLAVLLPWVWAEAQHVKKYVELCHKSGWDAVVVSWPMASMWLPVWGRSLALQVVQAIGSELLTHGERPVVFWAFSGSAKGLYSSLLSLLSCCHCLPSAQACLASVVLRCCVGQLLDSCPVDFTSDTGKLLLAPYGSTRTPASNSIVQHTHTQHEKDPSMPGAHAVPAYPSRAVAAAQLTASAAAKLAVHMAAGVLDFFLLEWFDHDREIMWTTLRNPPIHGPVLLLYSRNDHLADASLISSLATSLRHKGRPVLEQVWQDSPHVGHYRSHPQVYEECLAWLFSGALQEWAARSTRSKEGQEMAARWQQQRQQQPLPGVRNPAQSQSQLHREPPGHAVANQQQPPQAQGMHTVHHQQQQQSEQQHPLQRSSQDQQSQEGKQQLVMQPTTGLLRYSGQQPGLQPSSSSRSCSSSSSRHSSTTNPTSLCQQRPQSAFGSRSFINSCRQSSDVVSLAAAATMAAAAAGAVTALCDLSVSKQPQLENNTSSSSDNGASHHTRMGRLCNDNRSGADVHAVQQAAPTPERPQASKHHRVTHYCCKARELQHSSNSGGGSSSCCLCSDGMGTVGWQTAAVAAAVGLQGGGAVCPGLNKRCGRRPEECRCAETLAAAAGEIVPSDSAALSHSLRCLANTYLVPQKQQQQLQQQHYQQRNRSQLENTNGKPGTATAHAGTATDILQAQLAKHCASGRQQQQKPLVAWVFKALRSKL